jgi:hypothetical protein
MNTNYTKAIQTGVLLSLLVLPVLMFVIAWS